MKIIIIFLLLTSTALAKDYIYQGTYYTTSPRQGAGSMTFVLTPINVKNAMDNNNKYKGHFYATWQSYPSETFQCQVNVTGPINKLKCNATAYGGQYSWAGWVTKNEMKANFTGNYSGSIHLKRMKNLEK